MEFIKYEIKDGDSLETIANKNNLSVDELIEFHNENSGITQKIDREIPIHLKYLLIKYSESIQEDIIPDKFLESSLKYRCEQNVFTYINKVPVSNATTKRDFSVELKVFEGKLLVKVKLLDNILEVNPSNYTEAANVVAQLDLIKCNEVILQINEQDGSILKVVNHQDIIRLWEDKRREFKANAAHLDAKSKREVDDFINLINDQILIEENLIDDYKSKMFFDVYFNKYLVDAADKLDSYKTFFRSQLFEGQKTEIEIRQDIIRQDEDVTTVRKVSETISKNVQRAEELYNLRYKPMIGYQFSSYEVSYRERSSYNTQKNFLEELDVTIIEQIVNNLELKIHYTVRKIE